MAELDAFLKAARERGASDEFLVALMREHGWPDREIYRVLGRHYAEASGVPLPEAPGRLETAREAFFHLLAFATLGAWVCATGSIWFELINAWFPDPATYSAYAYAWTLRRISWEMASLMVAFPAFVFATRSVLRDLEANPDKAESGVRRWLTNIALLIAALISIGDLVVFVSGFLQGELTPRFALKCLTVFVLAGAVFLYYSRGLGKSAVPPRRWHLGFAGVSLGLIVLSLVFGFVQAGSPATQRLRAEDQRRLRDLHAIAQRLRQAWQSEPRQLPARLDELARPGGLVLQDPFTRELYGYEVVAAPKYRLCATFVTATPVPPGSPPPAWSHPAGRHCFDLDAGREPDWPGRPYY